MDIYKGLNDRADLKRDAEILYQRIIVGDIERNVNRAIKYLIYYVDRFHLLICACSLLVEDYYHVAKQLISKLIGRVDSNIDLCSYALDHLTLQESVIQDINTSLEYSYQVYTWLFQESMLTEIVGEIIEENYDLVTGEIVEEDVYLPINGILFRSHERFDNYIALQVKSTRNENSPKDLEYITLAQRLDEFVEFREQFNRPALKSARKR